MDFFTTDIEGVTLVNPGPEERRRVLESVLGAGDVEFPEVFLSGARGIVLGYSVENVMTWEAGGEVTRVLPGTGIDDAARIWDHLVAGNIDALDQLPWQAIGE